MTAVRRLFALPGALVFLLQEGIGYTCINVRPGQHFIKRALPVGIEAGFKSGLSKSTEPAFIIEVLGPGVKPAAQFSGTVQNCTHSSVAPR